MKIIALLVSIVLLACQPEPQVDIQDVTRIINTLASDEMNGRATFTEDIKKASDFIANEFQTIGLEKFNGSDRYEQDFSVYQLNPESQSVKINGRTLKADHFFSVKTAEINWTDPAALEVVVVDSASQMRSAFSQIRKSGKNGIVFVNPDNPNLKNLYPRYKAFMGRAPRTLEMSDTGSALVILSKPINLRQIEIKHKSNANSLALNNVVGVIPGKRSDEFVLFSAHYDHLGVRSPIEGDSIYNGANDNATGTTAVITLAKYFKQMGQPERTLLFVAFTAEEMGGYGSQYFSKQLNPDQIVAMFNIEMIGQGGVNGPNTCWITGFERSDFGKILQEAVKGTEFSFFPDPYPNYNLFYRSDNATLARLGVPAHSLSTSAVDDNPDYHKPSDHVSTLDLNHMTNTIKAIAAGARTIVTGEATPTRVDVALVD